MRRGSRSSPAAGIAAGIVVGVAIAAAAVWAISEYLPRPSARVAEPEPEAPPAALTQPAGFTVLDGPPPGPETPFTGRLVAFARWSDSEGPRLAILSRGGAAQADEGRTPVEEALSARLYRLDEAGAVLEAELIAQPGPESPGAEAAFYKDAIWASDIDGDGRGEAMFAYSMDESPDPGPKRLTLVAFSDGRRMTITGTTRHDPAEGPRAAMTAREDEAMAAAPEAIRAEARALWDEAQFDLAEPPAFPAFFERRRFDGATFRGEEPFWRLVILPQYMLLELSGSEKAAVIRYESIVSDGPVLTIEGKGEVEAWDHGFRVTLVEEEAVAPHGEAFPFSATVDWSDGTRLLGWGNLAE